ncbi:MAG: hypothetical protein H6559_10740 [Lewinellaceae bacterium]|nr:hypothetical protein [Lewinellaceae bacterium]
MKFLLSICREDWMQDKAQKLSWSSRNRVPSLQCLPFFAGFENIFSFQKPIPPIKT